MDLDNIVKKEGPAGGTAGLSMKSFMLKRPSPCTIISIAGEYDQSLSAE